MANLIKKVSTALMAPAALFAANASAQSSQASNQETTVTANGGAGGSGLASAAGSGVATNNTNVTLAPVSSNANANSLRDDSVTNNTNTANGGAGGSAQSAAAAEGGKGGDAKGGSATINNNEKSVKTVIGVGVVLGVSDIVAKQGVVTVSCVSIAGQRVMAVGTQGDALLSSNKAEMLLPQMSKKEREKFAKTFGLQTSAVNPYMPCPVEAPQGNFTPERVIEKTVIREVQAAPAMDQIKPLPIPTAMAAPAPKRLKVRSVKAKVHVKPAAKPCVTVCETVAGKLGAVEQRLTAVEAKLQRPVATPAKAPALRK